MIEQWYAVHKTTGEIFVSSANNYCFNTTKGLVTAIKAKCGIWKPNTGKAGWSCADKPENDFLIKKVELK